MARSNVSTQVAEVLNSQNDWHNTDSTPTSGSQLRMLGALASQSGCSVKYPREGLTMADVQAAARVARFIGADATIAKERLADAKQRAAGMRTPERFMWHPAKFELALIKRLSQDEEPLDIETANKLTRHCDIVFGEKASPKAAATIQEDDTDLDDLFS